MKKLVSALCALLLTVSLAGCAEDAAPKPQTASAAPASAVTAQEAETQKTDSAAAAEVDVDLTKLSKTMIYSEVYNMMSTPEDYIGKTVRMNGQFARYQGMDADGQPLPDQLYFACVIADATACCQQGLEFILAGEAKYPDDYPNLGSNITVVGKFQTYTEDQYQYCHLIDAVVE